MLRPQHPPPHTPGGRRALIAVVDDQAANLQTVGALLTHAGFDVMPAQSGEQALTRCRQRVPDVVLLDMLMPEMDGFDVLRALRSDPTLAAVPVIFLTAANERDLLVRAFSAGAVDYVTKPFVAEELLSRVRTHVELKRTRDHLVRIADERAELTQIVAHDLKNPLSSIHFCAAMILETPEAPQERIERLAAMVQTSAGDALRFIHNYLEQWAEGELRRKFSIERCSLRELSERAIDLLRPAADSRGMTLRLQCDDVEEVFADCTAARHVIENLVSNAIKYARADSKVDVVITPGRAGFLRLAVLDRGPGLSREDQKRLFRRFVRLGEPAIGESSGLGLAIAKQDVTQMGGHLWYEDRDDGDGACFCSLPIASRDAERPLLAPEPHPALANT